MNKTNNSNLIDAVNTTFRIIEGLSEIQPAGVSEVSEKVDIPVSTVYFHLNSLCHSEYVVKEGTEYRLSLKFLEQGGKVRNQTGSFTALQRGVNQLARVTGEIVGFAVEERGKRVMIYRNEGNNAVGDRSPVGERTHLHWTALGKAILAHLTKNQINFIIEKYGLPNKTKSTITNKKELMDELNSIRKSGYALDSVERRRGIRGVAVPVKKKNDVIFGSIGIAGPKKRFDEQYISKMVQILSKQANVIELESGFYE